MPLTSPSAETKLPAAAPAPDSSILRSATVDELGGIKTEQLKLQGLKDNAALCREIEGNWTQGRCDLSPRRKEPIVAAPSPEAIAAAAAAKEAAAKTQEPAAIIPTAVALISGGKLGQSAVLTGASGERFEVYPNYQGKGWKVTGISDRSVTILVGGRPRILQMGQ